ncbi:MAG: hypothetical protein Q9228_005132 [Teloschistes exilis]
MCATSKTNGAMVDRRPADDQAITASRLDLEDLFGASTNRVSNLGSPGHKWLSFITVNPQRSLDASRRDLTLSKGHTRPQRLGDLQLVGYNYQGCYTEATSGRALSGSSFFNDLMTVEKCAASCSAFPLFGVEYGRECFCGQSLNAGSVLAAETDCSFKCPGNSAETCGAGNRLNVYQKPVAPPAPKPTSYASEGCYTEPSNGRALTGKTIFDDSLTIEKCAMLCADFNYFGVEYYRECYCGNDLQTGSVPAASTDCKYPCKGDNSEICGGDYRLNLYGFGGMSPSSTTTASATATPSPSNYVSTGCYTEAKNSRALTGAAYVDDKMTTELCAAVCTGFEYFGTEYARECYCGNMLQDGSVPAPASDCSYTCSGNKAEKCGGSNRLNLYEFNSAISSSTSTTSMSSSSASSLVTSSTSMTDASTTSSVMVPETTSTSTTSTMEAPATASTLETTSMSSTSTAPADTTSITSQSTTSTMESSVSSSIPTMDSSSALIVKQQHVFKQYIIQHSEHDKLLDRHFNDHHIDDISHANLELIIKQQHVL